MNNELTKKDVIKKPGKYRLKFTSHSKLTEACNRFYEKYKGEVEHE